MIKKTGILVFAALLVFCAAAFSQEQEKDNEAKLNEIISKMEAVDKKVNTAEISYSQGIFYSSTKEKQNITGNLKYKKPDNIFIVQKTPQEQRVYINGRKITIYTPENSQAVTDNWKDAVNGDFTSASMVNFSGNWKAVKKENNVKYVGEDDKNYILEITPIKKNEWNMQLHVDKTSMLASKAIVTAAGLVVRVDISDYKVNPNFKKEIFKFTAPEGVEVIEFN
ncbi:MAG: outer membrane lipoprotein carrier protein LolA [Endomicrobium sp.]|jgi:outer membrane lipoprotein carrier protein|nr:outer membrane lipoprotein carrier protein LolA [Endomicrobium sp.]